MADDFNTNDFGTIDITEAPYVISSFSRGTVDFESYELRCPKCDCDKITFLTEEKGHLHLESEVRCYECGFEFTITENCWKFAHDPR